MTDSGWMPSPGVSPYTDIAPWIPYLLGAVQRELDDEAAWIDTDDEAALSLVQDLLEWIMELPDLLTAEASALNEQVTMWHDEATVITGNDLLTNIESVSRYNIITMQWPRAINDTFEQKFACAAGTYTLHVLGTKGADSGILTWSIDGTNIGSQDWYRSSGAWNTILTIENVVLTDGLHTLRGTVASSRGTGYRAMLVKYWLVKQ